MLCDFGLGKRTDDKSIILDQVYGPPFATAPEVLQGDQYDVSADVYAYGILLWDVVRFWMMQTKRAMIPMDLLKIIEHCLSSDKIHRPNMFDVCSRTEDLAWQLHEHLDAADMINLEEGEKIVSEIIGAQKGFKIRSVRRSQSSDFITFSW